jgi:hypothetical protein
MLFYRHEDGTVRFWNASGSCLQFMYKLSTCSLFNVDVHTPDSNGEMEEEWPPFRKVNIKIVKQFIQLVSFYATYIMRNQISNNIFV